MADMDRRGRADLAEVDRLELPLIVGTLLTIVKLLVDVPLLGAIYDIVPPPPLSAEPGVSLIAAGAAKDMSRCCLIVVVETLFQFLCNESLYHGPTNRSRSSRAGCLSQCPSQ